MASKSLKFVAVPEVLARGDLVRRFPRNANFRDRTGTTQGGSLVLGYAGMLGQFSAWLCRCSCGNRFIATAARLNKLRVRCGSCKRTYSASDSRLHRIWRAIISRCHNPNDTSYARYGARRIKVCQRWQESFEQFAKDVGTPSNDQALLVRVNDSKGYSPGNCRWATRGELNQSRTLIIEHNGERLRIDEWAARLGLSQQAISRRILICRKHGANLAEAVATPAKAHLPCAKATRRRQPRSGPK
jgi:hypothetical protein